MPVKKNYVRKVHARSNFAKQISDNSVLYLNEDKKRTLRWFHVCGNLNAPLNGIKYGFIRSVSYHENKIKHGKIQKPLINQGFPWTIRGFYLAEKEGFEPSRPFWGLHDFQSCALDQATRLLQILLVLPEQQRYYDRFSEKVNRKNEIFFISDKCTDTSSEIFFELCSLNNEKSWYSIRCDAVCQESGGEWGTGMAEGRHIWQ